MKEVHVCIALSKADNQNEIDTIVVGLGRTIDAAFDDCRKNVNPDAHFLGNGDLTKELIVEPNGREFRTRSQVQTISESP